MHIFEELKIWQNAQSLAVDVYLLFKDNKDWGFRDQI
ncbi:MAG: four helix bundle protein [Bacteroidales bacterium]|nr:four helix bundle protein [Bacteroidales bacterium]